jgi:dCMP deaminase
MNDDQIKSFLGQAYSAAATSPDKSNQNGAVLVREPFFIAAGCNTFPPGVDVTEELLNDRDKKLFYIEHAERNAIFRAVREGVWVHGTTLVCPWAACSDCARAIILCGIRRVIVHKQRMDMTPERWVASVSAGLKLLQTGGVEVSVFDGVLNNCPKILVNGAPWQP